jgi:uncharacterized protein YjbI with pentapeptide repeats
MVGPPPEAESSGSGLLISHQNTKGGVHMKGKKLVIGSSFLAIYLLYGTSLLFAFDDKQLRQLKKTSVCQKCDLSNAKLSGLDLTSANLPSTNLSGADLSGSALNWADLSKANLSGTNLSGASLFDADLSGADVSNANLTNANLTNAKWTNGKRCKAGSIGQCKQ